MIPLLPYYHLVSLGGTTYLVLLEYLVMAPLVPWCHNNISCCIAYLVSLQFLLADPVVLGVISVSRSGSTGSLVSTEYLIVAFLVP